MSVATTAKVTINELPEPGFVEHYVIGDRIVFLSVHYDNDAPNPLEDWDGMGCIFSLGRRLANYNPDRVNEELENNPHAVPLSYYEHGECAWGVAGTLSENNCHHFSWDGVYLAGVWVPDKALLNENGTLASCHTKEVLAQQACEAFTRWCNGRVLGYSISVYDARVEDGDLFDDENDYLHCEKKAYDSCWGFYDEGTMLEENINPFIEDLQKVQDGLGDENTRGHNRV